MGSAVTSLSISIPAYNEAATISQVLQEAVQTLDELNMEGEVFLIDDGSADATFAIAQDWTDRDSRIRILRHEKNLGFGTTLREIFQKPTKEWIFFAPGDGQVSACEVKRLIPYAEKSPFILGWRRQRADPLSRRLQAWVYNLLISAVMGRRVHDVDSVVLVKRSLAQTISLSAQSVFLHAELALRAFRTGAKIFEVPIQHRPRRGGRPQGAKVSTIFRTIADLSRYVLEKR